MLSFLLDERRLMGGVRTVLAQTNAAPIAVDDAVTVTRGFGSVSISVLDNDVDPGGQPLTLVSAFAALGTAVAESNNTVTYTAPPEAAGSFDTIVYEIADVEDVRDTGQVNITITDPTVTVSAQADNTLDVTAGNGPIDITVTDPAEFAGTYTADLADLATGPINLAPPRISGTIEVGEVLSATDGLWIYDRSGSEPTQSWQWQRAGADIPGETGTSYTVVAGDLGQGITVVETLTDGFGSRSASSVSQSAFAPSTDTGILAWWDADDASSITENAGAVSAWAPQTVGPIFTQSGGARQPTTGVRTLAGRNVLDFDGGDFFEQPFTLPSSGDVAFHMVLSIDSVESAFAAVLAVDAANDFQIDAGSDTQFDGRLNSTGIATATNLTGGPFSGAMILSVICDFTGTGQIEVFVGNALRASATYTTALDSSQMLHVMTNRSRNASINGAVGELIVTETVTNRALFHSYLAGKWGLS